MVTYEAFRQDGGCTSQAAAIRKDLPVCVSDL